MPSRCYCKATGALIEPLLAMSDKVVGALNLTPLQSLGCLVTIVYRLPFGQRPRGGRRLGGLGGKDKVEGQTFIIHLLISICGLW